MLDRLSVLYNGTTLYFLVRIHDAVLMWAYGVNRTLEQGGAPDDGEAVVKNIFNLSFTGAGGVKVTKPLTPENRRIDVYV